ncbi:universal stress protein [Desulfoluna spongiiphila]|uniref:universal stress protein n=1 Tax=Desulfoluna spongiiphila TaxID=419481 RepID=UPI0012539878|nr:universal stress protein [Desulfoluna spongiiphila]VVS95673.1 uspa [Desulfoluna spongiiphila]
MFKNILFTTTASPICDEAARFAYNLAEKYDSGLKVFHVYGLPSHGFTAHVNAFRSEGEEVPDADYETLLAREIQASHKHLADSSMDSEVVVKPGIPATEILRVARAWGSDLIVMGTHTRLDCTGAALAFRNIVGNTMQKVAKSARAPVLIINRFCPLHHWDFKHIVFGTDLSRASDDAFDFAVKIARESGARLHLFHALDIPGTPEDPAAMDIRLKEAREAVKSRFLPRAGTFTDLDIEVCEGVPYVEILKLTRRCNGDLIVMAHHGKASGEDPDMGSTVEQVVIRASCPVVSVNHHDKG